MNAMFCIWGRGIPWEGVKNLYNTMYESVSKRDLLLAIKNRFYILKNSILAYVKLEAPVYQTSIQNLKGFALKMI